MERYSSSVCDIEFNFVELKSYKQRNSVKFRWRLFQTRCCNIEDKIKFNHVKSRWHSRFTTFTQSGIFVHENRIGITCWKLILSSWTRWFRSVASLFHNCHAVMPLSLKFPGTTLRTKARNFFHFPQQTATTLPWTRRLTPLSTD